MTAEEIKSCQVLIHKMIQLKAATKYDAEDSEPIYDGVCDPEMYSESKIKVMWVLKEAYDDIDESGLPKGGGWEIFEKWGKADKVKEVTSVRSWQPIMYVLRALSEDNSWDDIAWIRDDREKYVEILRSCAYININKMPAKETSGDMTEKFNLWCDEINAQILAYKPDAIIFGNTIDYFNDQCYMRNRKVCNGVSGATDVYLTEIAEHPTLLINAYHPNQRTITRKEYVETILFSVRENFDKLIKLDVGK